jgi:hypothetical protein
MACHWLPYPFWSPQSGQVQVMPLQVMPQAFSCMQVWQMENPHRQRQQNIKVCLQQWHWRRLFRIRFSRRFCRREAWVSSVMANLYFSFWLKDSIYAFY